MYDLKLANASIVDGSGTPARHGDVGVVDGRIVAVGDAPEASRSTIDVEGRVVSPGFIDLHTHLDAQALFDPMLSISSWHGVTTAIAGNCGFGLAPTRLEHRDLMMHSLESVEGMDYACLAEGLGDDWGFISFSQYLDAVERSGVGINFAAYIGHTPVRLFVMGEEATERSATQGEIDAMRAIVLDALMAGAIGFSTSKVPSHVVWDGRPAPSRAADLDEILQVASALGDAARGVFMCALGPGLSIPEVSTITERTGRPATFAGILTDMGGRGQHRRLLDRLADARARGIPVVAQMSSRPLMVDFSLFDPYMLTNGATAVMRLESLEGIFGMIFKEATVEGKIAAYQRPGFREEFRKLTDSREWHELLWANTIIIDAPGNSDLEQRGLVDVAQERGLHPSELLLDLSLASRLETRFGMAYVNTDLSEIESMFKLDGLQIGLSDSGAHINQICDACYPTDFLGRWVRDRQAVSLEEGVAMLASRPAEFLGLVGRGRIKVGYAADLVVFDPDTVGASTPYRVRDLPARTARLVSDAQGVEAVIVNGTIVRRSGKDAVEPGGALPGAVLRSTT